MEKTDLYGYVAAKIASAGQYSLNATRGPGGDYLKRRVYTKIERLADGFLKSKPQDRLVLLPGFRGVGKTTILCQVYRHLTEDLRVDPKRVLLFSADESVEFIMAGIADVVKTYSEGFLRETLAGFSQPTYVLIDEAHFDKRWGIGLKILYDNARSMFFLVTGSSALELGVSPDLARRALTVPVLPMDFAEHLMFKGADPGEADAADALLRGDAKGLWEGVMRTAASKGIRADLEFREYLFSGGFPASMWSSRERTYDALFSSVERMVEKDMPSVRSFNTDTKPQITRIIHYLALQRPGGTSDAKLAEWLSVSSKSVRAILDSLEKAHLVFSVKPYGGAAKRVRKAWRYYFLSPSVNAALRFRLGAYDEADQDLYGILAEGMVAAALHKLQEGGKLWLFYDPEKGGADFIAKTAGGAIAIEVGAAEKQAGQLKASMSRYGCQRGILASGQDHVEKDGKVLKVPLQVFALV